MNGELGNVVDVLGGVDRPYGGHAELILQQHEGDQGAEVGSRGQVALPVGPGVSVPVGSGVDQPAEPGGGVVDELGEPGVAGERVPFADEDGD